MRSPVVVGRSAELAVLERLVDDAVAGAGGAVLVAGEAGIGKTRLLDEAGRKASEAGLAVFSGRAVQGSGTYRAVAEAVIGALDQPRPRESEELRPYRAALGRLLPGWGDGAPLPDVDQAVVLGEGLVRLLGTRPCLLRLDDLHWADSDTIALVEHLAGAVRARPVLVAVSARDVPVDVVRRLGAVPGITTLRPQRLGAAEVAALAAACRGGDGLAADELARLVARSEGVPFLVEELVGRTDGVVPPSLAALVEARLAVLDRDAREVVAAAAVIGGDPDWRLLAATVGIAEREAVRALRAAADAALLVADGSRLRWPHALTRDAVLSTLLPPERAELACCAAEALLRRAGSDDETRAAELFVEAGELERGARLLVRLARAASARGALHTAVQLLDTAATTGAAVVEVTTERVHVLTLGGRADEAIGFGDAALAGLRGDAHAELCLGLARAAVVGSRWSAAEDYVERAGRPDDPRSLVLRADAAYGAGRAREAYALAAAAVESAERAGAHATLCEALGIKGRAEMGRDLAAAIADNRAAVRVASEHGLTLWRLEGMAWNAMATSLQAEHDPAAPLHAVRELVLDAGMLAKVVEIDIVLTDHVLVVDGPVAAEAIARRAVETLAGLPLPGLRTPAEILRAGCIGMAGDTARMDALIEPVLRREDGNADAGAVASAVRAFAALHEHDLPRATAHADAATGFLLSYGAAPPLTIFGVWALLRTAIGDRDAEARAKASSHPSNMRRANQGALGYAEAIAAGRDGRAAEAEAHFANADATLVGLHWWRRQLRLLALEAAVADGWGEPVPALRADLAEHERSGDAHLARTCRDLLRQAGQPVRRGRGQAHVPPALRALGVTSREVDVLELVAQGLTNPQVAARLYLSPRTVDTHVASLLAKTGAASRAELRGLLG